MFNASIEVLVLLAVFLIYALYYEYRLMKIKNYIGTIENNFDPIRDKIDDLKVDFNNLDENTTYLLEDFVEWDEFNNLDEDVTILMRDVERISKKVFPDE